MPEEIQMTCDRVLSAAKRLAKHYQLFSDVSETHKAA